MAFVHGKESYFKLASTDLSGYVTKVSIKPSCDVAKTTTMGLDSHTYIPGLKDCKLTVDILFDATADTAIWAVFGAATTFEYGPAGSTGGLVKFSGSCIVTGYTPGDASVDKEVTGSIELQVTGDLGKGTF